MKRMVSLLGLKAYGHLDGYMERWWIVKAVANKSRMAVRLHHILRSDRDRAMHDHPWENASLVLRGGYWEATPGAYRDAFEAGIELAAPELQRLHSTIHTDSGAEVSRADKLTLAAAGVLWRRPLSFTRRRAEDLHRLILPAGTTAWTVFITWPKRREWGFATPQGWVHNVPYVQELGRDA